MKYTNIVVASLVSLSNVDSAWALRGSGRQLPPGAPGDKGPAPKGAAEPKLAKTQKEEKLAKTGPAANKVMKDGLGEVQMRTIEIDENLLAQISTAEIHYGNGRGYACRFNEDGLGGPGTYDNSEANEYFDALTGIDSLDECKEKCNESETCVGCEYGFHNERCELWKADIGHRVTSSNFGCYRKFRGAPDAVCRVDHSLINSSPYDPDTEAGRYYVSAEGIESLEACEDLCAEDPQCTGVGYNSCNEECELWKEEIGTILPVKSNFCFRKVTTTYHPFSNTTVTSPSH